MTTVVSTVLQMDVTVVDYLSAGKVVNLVSERVVLKAVPKAAEKAVSKDATLVAEMAAWMVTSLV